MSFLNPHLEHAAKQLLHELKTFAPELIKAEQHGTVIRIDDLDFAKILPNNRYRTPVATVQHVAAPPDESLFDRLYSTLNVARDDIRRILYYGATPADKKHLVEMLNGWADYTERQQYIHTLDLHDAEELAARSRTQYEQYGYTPFAQYRVEQDVLLIEWEDDWRTIGAIAEGCLYTVLGTTPIQHDAISTWFEQLDDYATAIQKWETSYAKRHTSEPRALFVDFRTLEQQTAELKRLLTPRKHLHWVPRYTSIHMRNRLRRNQRELERNTVRPLNDNGTPYDRFYDDLAAEPWYTQMVEALTDPRHAMNRVDPVAPGDVRITGNDDILITIGQTQHAYGWIVRGVYDPDRFVRPFELEMGLMSGERETYEEQIATSMNKDLRQLRDHIERVTRDYADKPYSQRVRQDVVRTMRTFAAVADYRFDT